MDWPDDEIGKNRSGSADLQAAMERHWSSGTSGSADCRRVRGMGSASADRPAVHIIRTSRFRMTIVTRLELLHTPRCAAHEHFPAKALLVVPPSRARLRSRRSIGIMPAESAAPIWLSALMMCCGLAQRMLSI